MSNSSKKLRSRPSRATTGPRPDTTGGVLPDEAARVIDAAGAATGAPPHAVRLCRQLLTAALTDDDGQRLGVLAGTAALDPRTAGQVIGVLAGTAAALAVR